MGRESQAKKQHGLIDYVHMSIDRCYIGYCLQHRGGWCALVPL